MTSYENTATRERVIISEEKRGNIYVNFRPKSIRLSSLILQKFSSRPAFDFLAIACKIFVISQESFMT